MGEWRHTFSTLAVDGDEWSAPRPGRYNPGIRAVDICLRRGLGDLKAGLDDVTKRKSPIIAPAGN